MAGKGRECKGGRVDLGEMEVKYDQSAFQVINRNVCCGKKIGKGGGGQEINESANTLLIVIFLITFGKKFKHLLIGF